MDPIRQLLNNTWQIARLPIDINYLPNDSRRRNGFQAFLISYYKELKKKDRTNQRLYVNSYLPAAYRNIPMARYRLLSPLRKKAYRYALFKAYRKKGIAVWSSLDRKAKEEWKKRARKLNDLLIPGRLNECPDIFFTGFNDLEDAITYNLYLDWIGECKLMKNC